MVFYSQNLLTIISELNGTKNKNVKVKILDQNLEKVLNVISNILITFQLVLQTKISKATGIKKPYNAWICISGIISGKKKEVTNQIQSNASR